MKNILLVIVILGMLAGIGSVYLGLTSRTKAFNEEKKKNDAIKAQQKAEEDKKQAEASQKEAELKAQEALKEKDTFDKIVKQANEAREAALKEAADAKKLQDEMDTKLKEVISKAEQARKERDEAVGKSDANEIIKQQAEKALEKALADLTSAHEEVAKIREISDKAKRVVQFINAFTTILFNNIEVADDNFKEGLETFNNAQTQSEKVKAVNLITEGSKKYKIARDEIKKLDTLNNNAASDIIKKISESINDNINCLDTTNEFLNSTLQANSLPNDEKRRDIYMSVRQSKEKADKLINDTFESLINLINMNKEAFTFSHLEMIKKAKDKIDQRLIPPPKNSEGN